MPFTVDYRPIFGRLQAPIVRPFFTWHKRRPWAGPWTDLWDAAIRTHGMQSERREVRG
jgi:hypothetical protein